MAMTPSELSLKVKSEGIAQAAKDLESLAKAAVSVDKETKDFVIAQSKVQSAAQQTGKSAEASARGISSQELAMVKAHEAALKMHNTFLKQAATAEKLASASEMAARGITKQELAMVKAHEQALKMNSAFDKQTDGLVKLHSSGSIWNNTLKSMAVAATAYIGVNFAKGVIEQADAWGLMQAKLKLSTGSMEAAKETQSQLLDLSQKIRIPLADSAQLYNRMAIPMAKMGKSAQETMNMVESMGLALKISGATAQEASSVMLQFSQSMNAGRLNGAEFNAVAEGAPIILRAIETELRATGQWGEHTTETLKKMGSEGKLSAELVSRAMQRALPEFRRDFESLPLTVDGALQRIKNAWMAAIGEISQDTEMGKKIAESISKLETMIPSFAKTVVNALVFVNDHFSLIITSLGIMTGASLISGISSMVAGLWAMATAAASVSTAMAAIPFVGILGVVATLGVNLGYLSAEWLNGKFNMEEYAKASGSKTEKVLSDSELLIKSIDKENERLEAQYKLMKGIKDVVDSSVQKSSDKEQAMFVKAQLDVQDQVIARFEKTKPLIAEQMKSIQEVARAENNAALAKLGIQDQLIARNEKFKEEDDRAKKRAELNKQYHFDTKVLIDEEIKKATDAGLKGLELAKVIKDANDKFKKPSPIVNKESLDHLEKAIVMEKELLQQRRQLEAGNSGKILESEKALYKNQELLDALNKKSLTTKEVILKKELELAVAKGKTNVAIERGNVILKEENDLKAKSLDRAVKAAESAEQEAQRYEDLVATFGMTEDAMVNLTLAREKELFKSMLIVSNDYDEIAAKEKLIKSLERTAEARKQLGVLQEGEQQAKKYEDAYQAANKKIADGLYNAIGKSGESAIKKLIRDMKEWFARLVLSPIINPISQFGASIINPSAASAKGGITDFMSVGKSIWDGFTGAGAASGAAFSQFAMSSLGQSMGLSSSTAASAMLAEEAALTGGALGTSSAGTVGLTGAGSAGVSAATAMPYVMAAIAAFQGVKAINGGFKIGGLSADAGALLGVMPRLFGMQDKVFGDQYIKGTLGTQDLTRNQPYTQKGGLFRSDRKDTWDYSLANSSTVRDGVTYTDTANLASDKAMLNQLNSTYDAVKMATGEFAKSLGLSAESLKTRTDAINFSYGKTADETTANIVKAFNTISDTIAKELLGDLNTLALNGEATSVTLSRLATTFKTVNDAYKVLGFSVFESGVNSVKAAQSMVDLAGGLDSFKTIASSYYDNFYKESDKTKYAMEELTKTFKTLSSDALPTSREGFKQIVDAAQKAGNNELVLNLMKLSAEFARLVPETDTATTALEKFTSAMVNAAFDKFGVVMYNTSIASEAAANNLAVLAGGIDNLKSVTASYYENFYTDAEKTAASMASVSKTFKDLTGNALPTSREDFRAAVDRALQSGSGELAYNLMKLSDEFGKLYPIVDKVALAAEAAKKAEEELAAANVARLKPLNDLKEAFKALTEDANKWLGIRNKASDLRASLDSARGIKSDPTMRIKKLWDALNSDASPEQKLELAGQLKDLLLSKYQIEKDSLTKLIDFGKQLRGYVEGLKIGSLSPLTMTQKIAEAQRQYETTLVKAKGGDATAQAGLQNAANNYLQLAQTAFASGQQYQDIFNLVTTSLDSLGLESMTYDQQSLNLASSQLAELEKLDGYLAAIESNADSHYNQTIATMVTQLGLIDSMEKKLGELSSIKATLDGLPAQIAASMYRQQNANFVTELYSKFAGKTGTQIDTQGMEYWISEVAKYGTMYTEKAFKDSVAFVNGLIANPPPTIVNNKAEIEALTKEVASLREDNAKQTMALIEATLMASNKNADTVVAGTKDALNSTTKKEVVIK